MDENSLMRKDIAKAMPPYKPGRFAIKFTTDGMVNDYKRTIYIVAFIFNSLMDLAQNIAIDQKIRLPYELGMDHTVYADFFKRSGNIIKAKERLDNAIDIFKECGADGWAKKIKKELAAL